LQKLAISSAIPLALAASIVAAQSTSTSPRDGVVPRDFPDVRDRMDERSSADPGSRSPAVQRFCASEPRPRTFEIRKSNAVPGTAAHRTYLEAFVNAVAEPNTTVVLAPDVVLDFSKAVDLLPVFLKRCVTLKSAHVLVDPVVSDGSRDIQRTNGSAARVRDESILQVLSGRTPNTLGPLLRFGNHPKNVVSFLKVSCPEGHEPPDKEVADHVIVTGVRIEGPSLGQQTIGQFGVWIERCLDVEISNNEIFGWGGAGVRIYDETHGREGPGQSPRQNLAGERIGRPDQVRIVGNYIHHNQHASEDESIDCEWSWDWLGGEWVGCALFRQHAAGYGVSVHHGAWALIDRNLFDVNRHAIAGSGKMGGYDARRNLVLKGGGYHGRTFHKYTHQFDIHGTDENGLGGKAGVQTWYFENSFQYTNGAAIKIRGRPALRIYIGDNIFAHPGLENDAGTDAVHLIDRDDLDVIELLPRNVINHDSFGRYGVCDFDGDGVDDLFLATGKTWWFSSYGEFPWWFLSSRTERLQQVRLGYFDDDRKCDVLAESGPNWVISSGGVGAWTSIGGFDTPLAQAAFGQFDPSRRDHRAGVTRKTTHAFRRQPNGQWQVTDLSAPAWANVQNSSFPMNALRFGDFTGDGVTDVLAVSGGRWSISDATRGGWTRINAFLGDDVSRLFIADLNNNNIDDLLKLEARALAVGPGRIRLTYTWRISDDGRSRWRVLKTYTWEKRGFEPVLAGRAFAGRFGTAPGGGVLLTDPDRIGHFYAPLETAVGASPDWRGLFSY
jgi:hypothetical protein